MSSQKRRLRRSLLAALILAMAATLPAQSRRAQQKLEEAERLIRDGNIRGADRILQDAWTTAFADGDVGRVIAAAERLWNAPIHNHGSATRALSNVVNQAYDGKDCASLKSGADLMKRLADSTAGAPEGSYDAGFHAVLERNARIAADLAQELEDNHQCRVNAVPPEHGPIRVVAGTYGENCRQSRGNRTAQLAKACNGKQWECTYTIDVDQLGDPAFGCAKNYVAEWRCGANPNVHRMEVRPEAGYKKTVTLLCNPDEGVPLPPTNIPRIPPTPSTPPTPAAPPPPPQQTAGACLGLLGRWPTWTNQAFNGPGGMFVHRDASGALIGDGQSVGWTLKGSASGNKWQGEWTGPWWKTRKSYYGVQAEGTFSFTTRYDATKQTEYLEGTLTFSRYPGRSDKPDETRTGGVLSWRKCTP